MPKIIVFTTAYYPFIGGAEIAIQETVRRLKDRFEFCIVTHRISRSVSKEEKIDGVHIYRLGFGTKFDRLFLFPFLAGWKGLQLLRGNKQALLWGVMVTYASIGAFFVKLLKPRIPFVLTIQEGDSEEHLRFAKLGQAGIWWWLLLKKVDHITAISTYLKEYVLKRGYRGKIEVIPNGVDVEKFRIKNQESRIRTIKEKVIVTISRLVYKNGVDTLITAVAEVKKTIPDIQCWIVGDGPDRKKLELQATSYKLQDNVKFFGSIPHDKIFGYLHRASVFVRPSRSEGMGNSFIEALAAGIPIIGTRVGGITDIIKDRKTGLFAEVDDSKDVAEKIIELLIGLDPIKEGLTPLAASIVREGHTMVRERFSWDLIAESYQYVFNKCIRHSVFDTVGLNILLATPLYPPQIGGPALYAKNLSGQFIKKGHNVSVLVFSDYMWLPVGIRHVFYLASLFKHSFRSDIIFALDQFTEGAAVLVSLVLRKPVVYRLEGDFLWEKFVERTRSDTTLLRFYNERQLLSLRERLIEVFSRWAIRRASILVFSSEWRRAMVVGVYDIPSTKTAIIKNSFPLAALRAQGQRSKVVLWAGRMLYLKNLHRLIDAFSAANDGSYELYLVGDGPERVALKSQVSNLRLQSSVKFFDPLPREKMLEKMSTSAFFVLPSLSDVGPNVIADAVATKTPFIMTKESGHTEYVREIGIFVDPLDEKDIAEKIKVMMDESTRKEYQKKLEVFSGYREWNEAAEEWINLFYENISHRS
jgi:glycosyltransferase involved in cell wall biosynthesis